ncbi:SDR family oxidoreductase [Roseobacter weihaiensis]|uniref:SDR family oxidoreductase n=1 Tax=Roseobacter weihaiensis TaxID=2763262 RepID=UPI001D09BBF5|nr:SDR family oxidoreductase [Roseobacter sp. H9]
MTGLALAPGSALVTGGATGIGAAIARALAQAGADVAITVNRSPGDEALALIEAAGRRGMSATADLGAFDAKGMDRLLDDVEGTLGPIGILVNNAGIIRRADAVETADADWDAVIDVNLNAVWRLTRAAGERMLPRGRGRIVTIASLLSFQGGIRVPAYAASKHAVAGLTKALANEWARHGVGVNAIAPGYIATDNTAALRDDPERARQILERIPAGRWGEAEDIAGMAVFLASEAAGYVHGQVIAVDGGWMSR